MTNRVTLKTNREIYLYNQPTVQPQRTKTIIQSRNGNAGVSSTANCKVTVKQAQQQQTKPVQPVKPVQKKAPVSTPNNSTPQPPPLPVVKPEPPTPQQVQKKQTVTVQQKQQKPKINNDVGNNFIVFRGVDNIATKTIEVNKFKPPFVKPQPQPQPEPIEEPQPEPVNDSTEEEQINEEPQPEPIEEPPVLTEEEEHPEPIEEPPVLLTEEEEHPEPVNDSTEEEEHPEPDNDEPPVLLTEEEEHPEPDNDEPTELTPSDNVPIISSPYIKPIVNNVLFFRTIYKVYHDIFTYYNRINKFKDYRGKLILTPFQLSALISSLIGIDESNISINCEPRTVKKYSTGKIYKINSIKVFPELTKNQQTLLNILTNEFDISLEYINASETMMTIHYL